ncbi:MAG TPA: helix-turn-helix transcriptional regulator [Opitutaceae bacterium]|nr:helix-turn-helix transcriptional regulator [Opitutaceae bacterium]
MDYPINTSAQLRAVLRGLRKARGLSQADTGARIGVNQKRVARIESAPGVTSFDQIARLVSALGGRLVIQDGTGPSDAKPDRTKQKGDW